MLTGQYDRALVLISVLVAVVASYTALSLAERVSRSERPAALRWIAGGAFAMGTGIWAMHFIGMLAFRLPIPMGYDLGITLMSWALPIGVSALALLQLSGQVPSGRALAASAVMLGLGINAMHYLGMAAMQMEPSIDYDPAWVAASVVIAIAAAGSAIWIGFRLRGQSVTRASHHRALAAVVMGLAPGTPAASRVGGAGRVSVARSRAARRHGPELQSVATWRAGIASLIARSTASHMACARASVPACRRRLKADQRHPAQHIPGGCFIVVMATPVQVTCRLPADLVQQMRERAVTVEGGVNTIRPRR